MKTHSRRTAHGFSLIEVMIAVIVLAVGLLSLAALQGELFRSGAEAKARANAATLAQQVIEDARTFGFVMAPNADYEAAGHGTYWNLESDEWAVEDVSGIDYAVVRDVTRYRYDEDVDQFVVNDDDDFSLSVPEFKMVRVVVSWTDSNGNPKSVQMADSIAAISPADVAKVMEGEQESAAGPQVWIEPPNKDNPRVVPIAVGDNQSAASSNPTPEQFVEDVSNITRFTVMSFTGATDAAEVKLTRKLDMAAASCICQSGTTSTSTNPAYKPTIWNGVQLAYEEPETMPVSTPIGTAVVANADSESEPMCTICCRDHFNQGDRSPLPDPYRESVSGDTVATKYGYKKQGSSYNVANLLDTSQTDGLYVDACQLVRVAGRMRMTVDAQQAALVTTALNSAGTGYWLDEKYNTADYFIDQFSGYVTTLLAEGMNGGEMEEGYPSAAVKFPAPTSSVNATYANLVTPADIPIAKNATRTLVSFGVYVDYLSEDTLLAYKCALEEDNTGECIGLGTRAPLDVLPFYAVNVASLGDWSTASSSIASVQGATYTNQGQLATVGGIVTGGAGTSATDANGVKIGTPVTLKINNSNSGLAGTAAVDLHDKLDSNYMADAQGFVTGVSGDPDPDPDPDETTNVITITVANAYSPNLSGFSITMSPSVSCLASNQNKNWTCEFVSPAPGTTTITFANYQKVAGNGNLQEDRKICVPPNAGVVSGRSNANSNTATETSTLTLSNLLAQDYALTIDVINQSESCGTGRVEAKFP